MHIDYAAEYQQLKGELIALRQDRDHWKRHYEQSIICLTEANEEITRLLEYKTAYLDLLKKVSDL